MCISVITNTKCCINTKTNNNKRLRMSLHNIPNTTAGIFNDRYYNITASCVVRALDRDMKGKCDSVISQWPNSMATILFLLVK